jgi:hypothetical protein
MQNILKSWSQQPRKGQKFFRIKNSITFGGSDRALAMEPTDRLTDSETVWQLPTLLLGELPKSQRLELTSNAWHSDTRIW